MASWVRTPVQLDALARDLRGAPAIAVDTEADSLHHHPGKLCLVQISDGDGQGILVDPLALPDLAALGDLFADSGTLKVLHAADNDLAYLKRLYRFTVSGLFDTAIAARFLGATTLGLDGLLKQYLDLEPGKSRQKDDWSRRPLTPEQEQYAVNDVLHLIPLRDRLVAELTERGRLAWVEEECGALAALEVPDRSPTPTPICGSRARATGCARPRGTPRAVPRPREPRGGPRPAAVHDRRQRGARAAGCASAARGGPDPDGARVQPVGRAALRRRDPGRGGARGEPPESELPVRPRRPRPSPPAPVRRRAEALRTWRAAACRQLGLEPGLVLPQRLIDRLAADPPHDLLALAEMDGFRHWRAALFGPEVLGALAAA